MGVKGLTVLRKSFNGGDMKHRSTQMYVYTMYAVTLNLRKS